MDRQMLGDILGFVMGLVAIGCATGVIITVIKWRGGTGSRKLNTDVMHRLDEIAERLSRLEATTDSSAVEIERISEGQRFTTKLLAERPAAPGTRVS